jgi:hypothetical protein
LTALARRSLFFLRLDIDDVLVPLIPWGYVAFRGQVGLHVAIRVLLTSPALRLIEKGERILNCQIFTGSQAASPLRRRDVPPRRRSRK